MTSIDPCQKHDMHTCLSNVFVIIMQMSSYMLFLGVRGGGGKGGDLETRPELIPGLHSPKNGVQKKMKTIQRKEKLYADTQLLPMRGYATA